MRLLDTTTFEVKEFTTIATQKYAVLSHLWNNDEISLEELQKGSRNRKIERFCAQARADGLKYAWIDTCCVDFSYKQGEVDQAKKDEHEEAINSMYEWFARAEVCYAYLEDVNIDSNLDLETRRRAIQRALLSSNWFTSGWSLIELIAPPRVYFYQANWAMFGTKESMRGVISKITGIPQAVLTGLKDRSEYTVFERMAWARDRMTTGLEDQAYCLMGLFEVKMSLDYTEGTNAFLRLREEIKRVHGSSCLDEPAASLRLLRIDCDPLRVESHPFAGGRIPDYAILSHTWTDNEITFQDLQSGKNLANSRGYQKVQACCQLARKHGFNYVWVDTCCIDRTSSAELQEAICSMYRWYSNAKMSVTPDHSTLEQDIAFVSS